ncbi:glycosyltransferase [candidate division KSB1 bacterium]|nr:MAG: glycosyltransferase [candidate division KSB1 bacterium]
MQFLFYPLALLVTFGLLLGVVYRKPGNINRVFAAYRRPRRLTQTIAFWMAGIVAVFGFVQWMRWPYYVEFFTRLSRFQLGHSSVGEILTLVGMTLTMLCEAIVIIHWMMYLVYCWIGATRYRLPQSPPLSDDPPEVLVLITCCNEEPFVVRRSLSTVGQIDYPRARVVLLENSRDLKLKAQAAQIAAQYGVEVLHVKNRGHKAGAMNDALALLKSSAEYLCILDADQRVAPNILRDLVPLLEADPKAAFVQTSQLYENCEETWLSRAAAQQESLLYDTVLEAKGALGRALCCGTNFVMRMSALRDVGGWDERTMSEDLCTSFLMNRRGWTTLYLRKAYGWGIGPLNLLGYWKQQRRWASGNTAVAHIVLRDFLKQKPERLPFRMAVGYLWSAGYYITALALAVLATLPMILTAVSFLNTPQLFQPRGDILRPEWLFLSVYPLYAMIMLFPYVNMRMRGYPIRNLVMLQGLLAITIPVYLASALRGFFRRITEFEIAPKKLMAGRISFVKAPQTYLMLLLLAAGSVLGSGVVSNPGSAIMWIGLFWTFVYTLSFGHFFIFAYESYRLLKDRGSEPDAPESETSAVPATDHVEETSTRN